MKRAALLVLACLLLTSCQRWKKTPVPAVNPAPVIASQEGKDKTILAEAAQIDAIAPQAKPHTDAQRAAVAAAPAADVSRLIAEYEAKLKADDKRVGELEKTIKGLETQITELKNQALREQARWLTWSGVGLLAAFGVSIALGHLAAAMKTWPLGLLGVGCFGLAQLISHPWFLRSFLGLLIAAAAYSAYYVYDRHKEGRLRRSLEKKADVLKQIVPVLDEAYDSAADSVKQALDANVFDRLSSAFSREQKALLHEVRAEVKTKH